MNEPWLELAKRVTAAERLHRGRAEEKWQAGDVLAALKFRGVADGLGMARDLHLGVIAETRRPAEETP